MRKFIFNYFKQPHHALIILQECPVQISEAASRDCWILCCMWDECPRVQVPHYCRPKKNAFVEFFFRPKNLSCTHVVSGSQLTRLLRGVINLELKEKAPSKCLICQRKKISKKIKGWAYVSTCGEYCYHVKCVKDPVDKKFDQQSDGTQYK
jgi:hypothetical protein